MRIALISDIHGNVYALERVVQDIAGRGVDSVIFLGDVGFLGLYPQHCHDILEAIGCGVSIRGNTDENLYILDADPPFVPENAAERMICDAVDFMASRLDEPARKEILNREIAVRVDLDGSTMVVCHGSPYGVTDRLVEEESANYLERIEAEQALVIGCGHTHIPSDFLIGPTRILNPGAIGYAFDGFCDARYLIMDYEGGRLSTEQISVTYDRDRYCADIRAQNPVFRDSLLHLIQFGRPLLG